MGQAVNVRREADNEAKAVARNLRVSPQKLNLVAQLIRGKKAQNALADLQFSRKRIARDVKKALRFARHVSSGQVFINQYFAGGVETPFGGTKNSGFGREKGLEGLKAYFTVKTITARL